MNTHDQPEITSSTGRQLHRSPAVTKALQIMSGWPLLTFRQKGGGELQELMGVTVPEQKMGLTPEKLGALIRAEVFDPASGEPTQIATSFLNAMVSSPIGVQPSAMCLACVRLAAACALVRHLMENE